MCGIVGFVGLGTAQDTEAMSAAVIHRGPDQSGVWNSQDSLRPVSMGFRRLIVIDPEGGQQPMIANNDQTVLVCNGEIYNAVELRRELEELGQRFRSDHSDIEVLLNGYRVWGRDVLSHLSGMFAFVFFDAAKQILFGARDRFGKKPLFYSARPDAFVFGSELTSVLRHSSVNEQIDRNALKKYFAFGFVPAPETIYEGVMKLEPGHWFEYRLRDQSLTTKRYWSYRVPGSADIAVEPAIGEFRDLLDRAVSNRLQSDVALGAFLSGGVDSSAVTAIASRLRPDIETFCLGFRTESYDESSAARACSSLLGTKHFEKTVDLDELAASADRIFERMDEPIADPSLVPTFLLSRFAKERVTVALSGDGGDELFAGYDTFAALKAAGALEKIAPQFFRRQLSFLSNSIPVSPGNMSFDFRLRRFSRGIGHGPAFWHPLWLAPASLDEISSLFGEPIRPQDVYGDVAQWWDSGASPVTANRAMEFYGRYYLSGNILTKIDRSSMLNSLEVRCPFLDRDLVDFVANLPIDFKFRSGKRKWLLKQAVKDILPSEILDRPKKGFGLPLVELLAMLPMAGLKGADELGLDTTFLDKASRDQVSGRSDHRGLIWAWLSLAGFLRRQKT